MHTRSGTDTSRSRRVSQCLRRQLELDGLFGDFAAMLVGASAKNDVVALLPHGLVDLPAQLRARLAGGLSGDSGLGGVAAKKG